MWASGRRWGGMRTTRLSISRPITRSSLRRFSDASLLPAVLLVVVFTFFPLFSVIRSSFANYVLGEGITGYVGFANYVDVLSSDRFWHSILVTVIFVVVAVPVELALGFLA